MLAHMLKCVWQTLSILDEGEIMKMFFLGSLSCPTAIQVLAEIARSIPDENVEVFQTVAGLSKRLREMSAHPEIFVFVPVNQKELVELLGVQELLGAVPLILILPDQDQATVQYGHLLRPRFLTFGNSRLSDVGDVIGKLKNMGKTIEKGS